MNISDFADNQVVLFNPLGKKKKKTVVVTKKKKKKK